MLSGMDSTLETEVVQYPTVEIAGTKYPVKITCGTMIRLQHAGLNLFSLPPYDQNANESSRLLQLAASFPDDPEKQSELTTQAAQFWSKVSPDRIAWEHPLEASDLGKWTENNLKTLAETISTPEKRFTTDDLLELDDPLSEEIVQALHAGVKKVLSRTSAARSSQLSGPR